MKPFFINTLSLFSKWMQSLVWVKLPGVCGSFFSPELHHSSYAFV